MFQEKIKTFTLVLKKNTTETFKLLWQFKWYVLVYLFFYFALVMEYLNPPEKNSPLWKAEAMEGSWNYINKEVYMGSLRDTLIEFLLLFFIATSNMRLHPLLAKSILLFPLICALLTILISMTEL